MPAGRPTKYHDGMPDEVYKIMARGYSQAAAAGHIGVTWETFDAYKKNYPQFLDAVNKGIMARVLALETGLLDRDIAQKVGYIFALKNADPENWRDRREVETTGDMNMTFKTVYEGDE